MNLHRFDGELSSIARLFLSVSVTVIALASLFGAAGAVTANYFLLKLHPYLFFIGFGNLAILILNRYLTAAIYPELKIDPLKQMRYIYCGSLLSCHDYGFRCHGVAIAEGIDRVAAHDCGCWAAQGDFYDAFNTENLERGLGTLLYF